MAEQSTIAVYPLDGTNRKFVVPYEYLARRFVTVTLLGTDRKPLVLGTDFRFISANQIETTQAWGDTQGYANIEVRRVTSATQRLVDFYDGSVLRSRDLNVSAIQTIHIAEEARNLAGETLAENLDGNLDARFRKMVNLGVGTDDFDAVTVGQMKTWSASALNQANRSESEADRSQDQATLATQRAAAALASQNAAKVSETNSKTSETNAEDSKVAAKTSETNAKTSENASLVSQNAAKVSETNAKTSELAAEGFAAEAEQSAQAAAQSAAQSDAVSLRQDLASPDKGALMVRAAVIYVDTIADLRALDTSKLVNGATAELSGYDTAGDGGGGPRRIYKAGAPTGTYVHDGVSVIVPNGGDGSVAWVWEYTGTIDARWFGVDVSGETNTTTELTNYLQYMQSSQNIGSCSGTFLVTAPFLINMTNGRYLWDATFVTDNVSEIGLEIRASRADMFGKISVVCADRINNTSEDDYYARRQEIGAYLTRVERSRIGRIETKGTKRTGILIDHVGGNSNMFYVDHCQTHYAGSGHIFKGNATSVGNSGADNSAGQRCMVTTQEDIPPTLAAEDYCAINGQLFVVVGIDSDNKTLELYPQANQETVGEISYYIGEGVRINGNDTNVGHIRLIDSIWVGTAVKISSLYGPKVDVIHTNNRGVGASIGSTHSKYTTGHICRGGYIGWLYNEEDTFELVEVGLNIQNWSVITSGDSLDIDHVMMRPRNNPIYKRSISTQRLSEISTPQIRGLDLSNFNTESHKISLRAGRTNAGYLLIGKEDAPSSHKWGVMYGARSASSYARNSSILQFSMVTQASGAAPAEPAFYFEDNSFGSDRVIPRKVEYDGDIWYALYFAGNSGREGARFVIGSGEFKVVSVDSVTVIENLTGNYSKYLNETLRFLPNGEIRPLVDGIASLGSSAGRWDQLYATNGTINTSDEREKQQVSKLSNAEAAAAVQLKGMIRKYKWNRAVESKGDGARWHFGVMAQDVKQAFAEHGLDAHDYGLLCYDEWYEGPELIDEETGEVIEQESNRDRYGVRYDQLLAFIISAM